MSKHQSTIDSSLQAHIGPEVVCRLSAQPDAAKSETEEVSELEDLNLAGLRERWRDRYGPPPKLRSVELLRLMLAWRIQAEAFGGLDAATKRSLKRPWSGSGRRIGARRRCDPPTPVAGSSCRSGG